MTYRDARHAHTPTRRLIDFIPTCRNDAYAFGHTKWPRLFSRTSARLPRRIKRSSATLLALVLLLVPTWYYYLEPRYAAYKQELKDMETAPDMSHASNARPEFTSMIQVSDMDEQYLPKEHNRLVFVGDVHGCRDELEHLLEKIGFDKKHDHLVLTGDMVSKGPDSPGVIKLAQNLGASCVRGNWEDKLLLSIAEAEYKYSPPPKTDDGESLQASSELLGEASHSPGTSKLHKLAKKFTKSEITFLQQCPVILRVGQVPSLGSVVVVHAGLVPDTPLEQQDPFHVMNMRTIDLKTRIPSSDHGGTPWDKFWNHQQEKLPNQDRVTVVYGHNRKQGLNIRKYSYGLDTGCVGGGRLTALVVDGRGRTRLAHVMCHKQKGYDLD